MASFRRHGAVLLALLAAAIALPATGQTTRPGEQRRETIEADVSTRTIAVDAGFAGTQVVIFGTVENSRQVSPDARIYDVAVVIAGPREEIVSRRKSNVGGIWVNTASCGFKDVASYYAVVTTRPIGDIAPRPLLWQHGIGFENMRFATDDKLGSKELEDYRDAVLRIKTAQGLYREVPRGVAFIGKSLFRATVDLPANVTIGEFTALIFLFRDGELLSTFKTRLGLEREGIEQTIYSFAFRQPFWYGVVAVGFALLAGLIASQVFRRD